MAELSLIAGMNYLGKKDKKSKVISKNKKTNDQIILDSYKQSPYHSTISKESGKSFDRMYEKNMDSAKYMIPSSFVPDEDAMILGAGTDELGTMQGSFEDQFVLQKSSSKKVRASNEGREGQNTMNCLTSKWANFNADGDDMTLGVIDKNSEEFKHNNMHAFNRMRDFAEPDYEDNRPLEAFTGYSEHYVPKREMKPLFKPTKNSTITNDAANLIALEEQRMYETVGLKKNGQRLMEPKQNAPVLGLTEEDEFYGGGYDSTRIMPKSSNELRRADNQQISYQAPMMHGKKGSKRPTMPVFEKRRANLVEENRESFHSGGLRSQRNNDNIELKDISRQVSQQVIGPKAGLTGAYTPKIQGKIKQSQKVTYKGQVGGASMTGKMATQDVKSMQVYDTQRMYTNSEYRGNAQGHTVAPRLSSTEVVRGKQELERMQDGHAQRKGQGQVANNYWETIRGKQELERMQDGHAQRGSQGQVANNYWETIRGKQELERMQDGHAARNAGNRTINYNDKIHGKQELENFQNGHAARGSVGNRTIDYNERINGKQSIGRMADGHASRGSMGNMSAPTDRVRATIKQSTVGQDRSTFVGGPIATIASLQDNVRDTIKQFTVGQDRSTFVGGPIAPIAELQDNVRATQKQMHVQQTYQAPVGQNLGNGYITDQVTAPTTIRQQNVTVDHFNAAGSSALSSANPVDSNVFFAPTTLKQLHTQQYIGNAGNNFQAADQQQYYTAQYANKDTLLQGRAPTAANVNAIPTAMGMGAVTLSDNIDQGYIGLPSQRGHDYQTNMNVEQRIMPYHDENIKKYGTLNNNPYVNSQYFGYK